MTNEELLQLIDLDTLHSDLSNMFITIEEINEKIPVLEDNESVLLELEDTEIIEEIQLIPEEEITDTEILISLMTEQNELLKKIDSKLFTEEQNVENQQVLADIFNNSYFTNIIFILFVLFYLTRFVVNSFTRHM